MSTNIFLVGSFLCEGELHFFEKESGLPYIPSPGTDIAITRDTDNISFEVDQVVFWEAESRVEVNVKSGNVLTRSELEFLWEKNFIIKKS